MYEQGATFREYVKEYELARGEGVLLRYLSDAYKALVQNVPESKKTDALYDITEWLGAIVRQVDSSLLDEWERMLDPARALEEPLHEASELEAPRDITADPKGFTVLVRNAAFRLLRALALHRWDEASEAVDPEPEGEPWTPERIADAFAPYLEAHGEVLLDAGARSPRNTIVAVGEEVWDVTQVITDLDEDRDYALALRVDLPRSRREGRPVTYLLSVRGAP